MIGDIKQFIFIQIPKTGCTSIQQLLAKTGGRSIQGADNWNSPYFKHITYRELQDQLPGETIDQYYSFTFVRNPYDWLVSNYEYCRGVHVPYMKRHGYKSWEEFGKRKDDVVLKHLGFKDWLKWYVDNLYGTQYEMIVNDNDEIGVDYVGKLENIQQDYEHICEQLDISKQTVPHVNKTDHDNYSEYYDDESREIVQHNYKQDFELLGYTA